MAASPTARFSSRFALLMSMLGIAVGTGNIWRFPRIAAAQGGAHGAGAFLLAWAAGLLTWSLPLIIAEYALGRGARRGVVGAFASVGGLAFARMGTFVALVATAIMFYYSVVAGWCFYYLGISLAAPLPTSLAEAQATWNGLHAGFGPVALHAVAIGACALIVWRGVASIERVNRVLVPVLLVVVALGVLRAITLPGAGAGLTYLFTPDMATLAHPRVWLEALTQNAWDTGAGWGLILTYAAYMRREDFVVRNAVLTGVGNNLVSLLAATMIFATVFAVFGAQMPRAEILAIMRESGPASTGLTFQWMPQLFAKMPGGRLMAVAFFLGLSFAALSSLVSMVELVVRLLVDAGVRRSHAVPAVILGGYLLGLPSALSTEVLGNQDFVWGVGLMISGLSLSVAVARAGARRLREQELAAIPGDLRLGAGWDRLVTWGVPIQAVLLLGWWMYLSATTFAPGIWMDPFEPYSVATCLAQWSLAALASYLLAPKLVARLARPDAA